MIKLMALETDYLSPHGSRCGTKEGDSLPGILREGRDFIRWPFFIGHTGTYIKEGCGEGHLSQLGFCEGTCHARSSFTKDPEGYVK
jgi:hypothetical protein